MTSPPREVIVECPQCGHRYQDWYRPSINLDLEHFDDEYLDKASSAVCPKCGRKVYFGSLVVRDGVFVVGPTVKSGMHPVDSLFAALKSVEPYPSGVVPVSGRIARVAFFPGGAGLWGVEPGQDLPPMPTRGVMVLGHDFHSEDAFLKSLAKGSEVPSDPRTGYRSPATWVALRPLLGEASIPLSCCFFTNAYMGLRQGRATTGRFPGSRDVGFKKRCRSFFLRQLEAQSPALVITLGKWVPEFVAPLAPRLSDWNTARTLAAIDAVGPLVDQVVFEKSDVPPCTVVALTHPSLRGSNVRHRRYAGLKGHAAELAMLRDALSKSDIPRPCPE